MLSGVELKVKRILLNVEAQEIAKYLGISKSYISLMEKGSRNIPLHTYEKWTEFLGINKIGE